MRVLEKAPFLACRQHWRRWRWRRQHGGGGDKDEDKTKVTAVAVAVAVTAWWQRRQKHGSGGGGSVVAVAAAAALRQWRRRQLGGGGASAVAARQRRWQWGGGGGSRAAAMAGAQPINKQLKVATAMATETATMMQPGCLRRQMALAGASKRKGLVSSGPAHFAPQFSHSIFGRMPSLFAAANFEWLALACSTPHFMS